MKAQRKLKSAHDGQPKRWVQKFAPKIENILLNLLRSNEHNARVHSEKQLLALQYIIAAFGIFVPILIDENNVILAGHARLEVARRLGMTEVPIIRISHLTKAEKRAFAIADNKIAAMAGWDEKLLGRELKYLIEVDAEFDVTITGFETAEIDILIEGIEICADDSADTIPVTCPTDRHVSQLGDIFGLQAHRLGCMDATDLASYELLLGPERAHMGFHDFPYNVKIGGHVSGLGRQKHREFIQGAGEMSDPQYVLFVTTSLANQKLYSLPGAVNFAWSDWRHVHQVIAAGKSSYGDPINLCVWVKDNGGMGSLYRSQHELVVVFKHHGAPHTNNVQLGRMGRYRTNVWNCAGVNSFKKNRSEELAMHPTVKPVALVMDAIKDVSNRGDIVLDCFMGSGTTIIAAEKTGRRAYGMELDPLYVDTAIRRWQDFTGEKAIHLETGLSFDELKEKRHV